MTSVLAPQVSGTAAVGRALKTTTGTWSTNGLSHTYQWLRDGAPIAATGSSYRVTRGDVGKRLSVRVTATKQGLAPATATNRHGAGREGQVVGEGQGRQDEGQKAGTRVTVTAKVKATGSVKPRGKVRIVVDGSIVRTVTVVRGKATASIVRKGKHRVVVRYLGSKAVARSTSARRVVRGT